MLAGLLVLYNFMLYENNIDYNSYSKASFMIQLPVIASLSNKMTSLNDGSKQVEDEETNDIDAIQHIKFWVLIIVYWPTFFIINSTPYSSTPMLYPVYITFYNSGRSATAAVCHSQGAHTLAEALCVLTSTMSSYQVRIRVTARTQDRKAVIEWKRALALFMPFRVNTSNYNAQVPESSPTTSALLYF